MKPKRVQVGLAEMEILNHLEKLCSMYYEKYTFAKICLHNHNKSICIHNIFNFKHKNICTL